MKLNKLTIALVPLMASCQTLPPVAPSVVEPVAGHPLADCATVQRDLTLSWKLRQYWCAPGQRQDQYQSANDEVMSQYKSKLDYVSAINAEAESMDNIQIDYQPPTQPIALPDSQSSSISSPPVELVVEPVSDSSAIQVDIVSDTFSASDKIYFANNHFILGPQGREVTASLAESVAHAKKVLLRGLILPDEILVDSDLYREKVSVARALAVRKYWQDMGIDISHISILHHSPDLSGRYVEVRINA